MDRLAPVFGGSTFASCCSFLSPGNHLLLDRFGYLSTILFSGPPSQSESVLVCLLVCTEMKSPFHYVDDSTNFLFAEQWLEYLFQEVPFLVKYLYLLQPRCQSNVTWLLGMSRRLRLVYRILLTLLGVSSNMRQWESCTCRQQR